MRNGKIIIVDNMSDKISGRYFCSILMESIDLLTERNFSRKIWSTEINLTPCLNASSVFHISTQCLEKDYFEYAICLMNRKGVVTREPLKIAKRYELPRIVIQDSLYNSFDKQVFLIDPFKQLPVKLEFIIDLYRSVMNANRKFTKVKFY